MVAEVDERTTFSATEVEEIRRLLDEFPGTRLAIRRMNLARLRHMGLGISTQPEAQPTRDDFEELLSSGLLSIDTAGNTARAAIRQRPSNVFRVAVGVTGRPVDETWSAFDQRYQWFGKEPKSVTSGAHLFVLAVDRWKSAVVGLYEAVTPGADKLPDSPDTERWPWALGVRPLAAIPPPEAERVEGQQGPQNGLPAHVSDPEAVERLYEAVVASPPPPGPQKLEQRVQELEWQDVAPDVLEAVRSLGSKARGPNVISRAIELGGWTQGELKARAWHTGSGVVRHVERIVRQAMEFELGLTKRLQRTHGVYSVTGPPAGTGFGVTYRGANDDKPAEREPPELLVDLAELDRATKRHMDLQDRLAEALRERDLEPRSPGSWQPQFDLAFEHDGERFVVEVKSGNPVSTQQMRLGSGQVLEYRHLLRDLDGHDVHAVLLIEGEPPRPWYVLAAALGIQLIQADKLEESLAALLSVSRRFPRHLSKFAPGARPIIVNGEH
jgi:hypothetical protein